MRDLKSIFDEDIFLDFEGVTFETCGNWFDATVSGDETFGSKSLSDLHQELQKCCSERAALLAHWYGDLSEMSLPELLRTFSWWQHHSDAILMIDSHLPTRPPLTTVEIADFLERNFTLELLLQY